MKPGSGQDGSAISGRITINDIARLAEVSKKTVSRVLNNHPLVKDETRKRVKAIMDEHGYSPDPQARALAFRRSFLIGLAYDNPSPQYVVNMQRGILDALEGTDYQLVLQPVDRQDPDYIGKIERFVERHRPTGLIMPPSVSEDDAVAEMLVKHNCDFIRIASVDLDEPARLVRTHDAEGAAQAARHLANLGHKQIAHIHGPRSFRSAHERLFGFRQGLSEFGIELSPSLTIEAGYTFDSGVHAADNLLSRPDRPTAIFTGNDEMAIGVYTSARNAGLRVPEDLSIVGFDDTPMASRIAPALTTVRLPIREMGQEAARGLMRLVSEAGNKRNDSFKPEIIVRRSTARPS
ncbi:LacI family DNA-binding transcriptional regulator [Henriciella sp.]|uniref:LacI family DNA-binding transcriptional regulator n=1 Tax=Henriciella sp. TaxID=1968823 RepID=UPI003C73624F